MNSARSQRGACLLPLLLIATACGAANESEPPPPPPGDYSALLVTLDTTRADALGCFGGRRNLTPALDALAAEGLRYERAYTVTPLTQPAHASMMTGLYPPRHGVRDNGITRVPAAA